MGHVLANNTFNLYCRGLKKVREIEHLKITLVDDEIAFREQGYIVVREVSLSLGDLGLSMSVPNLFTSLIDFGTDPSISATNSSTSCMSWGDACLFTS